MDDKSQRSHAANPRWLRATRIGAALPLLMLLIAVGGSALIESLAPDSADFSELRAILGVSSLFGLPTSLLSCGSQDAPIRRHWPSREALRHWFPCFRLR